MAGRSALPAGPSFPPAVQRLAWATRPLAFAARCRQDFGEVFTLRFGGGLTLVCAAAPGPAAQALEAGPEVVARGAMPTRRRVLGDASVVVLDGAEHECRRSQLTSALTAVVARQDAVIARAADAWVGTWPRGGPGLSVVERAPAFVQDVLLEVVCGLRPGPDGERLRAAWRELRAADAARRPAPSIPLVRRWWGAGVRGPRQEAALTRTDGRLMDLIAARRREPGVADRADVLSALIAGTELPDRALRDQVLTLLQASGHDPLVSTLGWTFELLARRPAVADRVRDDPEYARSAVMEILRLRPPLWLTSARHARAPVAVGEHVVPAGTKLTTFTHLVHRDPAAFPDPAVFRPERFLGPDAARHWIPFGGGHRHCLGDELALTIATTTARVALNAVRIRSATPRDELPHEVGSVFLPAAGGRVIASEHA